MNRKMYRRWRDSPVREALRQAALGRPLEAAQLEGLDATRCQQLEIAAEYLLGRAREDGQGQWKQPRRAAEADRLSALIVEGSPVALVDADADDERSNSELARRIIRKSRGW